MSDPQKPPDPRLHLQNITSTPIVGRSYVLVGGSESDGELLKKLMQGQATLRLNENGHFEEVSAEIAAQASSPVAPRSPSRRTARA